MKRLFNYAVKAAIIVTISFVFLIFSAFWYFSSIGLPDYKKLTNYQPPVSSRVYSEDRKLIAEYVREKIIYTLRIHTKIK